MTIGEKIRFLRIKNKLTQEELADAVGTKKQTIHKYETGIISNIPASKIKSLADSLNTTPAYLMGWDVSAEDEESNFAVVDPTLCVYNELNALGKLKASDYMLDLSEQEKYTKHIPYDKEQKYEGMRLAAFGGDMKGSPDDDEMSLSPQK